ncbi:MAG: metallophosphoesterase [Bacteroidales bacterium]|nr:metallophosphoesterase [Bacteroidales bacterium]
MLRKTICFGILVLTLFGCDNLIEYSSYEVSKDETGKHRNLKAINTIAQQSGERFKPFKIALIGDSHTYYDDFTDQINAINKLDSVDLVVHLGDITLSGIYREFVWYGEIIDKINKPIITIIGNHDCLANGESMYQQMFGPSNFVLEYSDCQLVFFNDIIWERNVKDPDFEWLEASLSNKKAYTHQFVFAHIPPWDEQFSIGNGMLYNYLMENNQVSASVHGHTHRFSYSKHYDGNVPYLVTGDSEDREIVVLEVQQDTILVDRKSF